MGIIPKVFNEMHSFGHDLTGMGIDAYHALNPNKTWIKNAAVDSRELNNHLRGLYPGAYGVTSISNHHEAITGRDLADYTAAAAFGAVGIGAAGILANKISDMT